MVRITVDRDPNYAPVGYLICKVDDENCWDTRDENTILVDSDWNFPHLASWFGFGYGNNLTETQQISAAIDFLDEHLGMIIEDPGYFEE